MASRKSQVCRIGRDQEYLSEALYETEYYAQSEGLSAKQRLHMRLLCEELLGMVDTIVHVTYGDYWIERGRGGYELHLEAKAVVTPQKKASLLEVAPKGKNSAYAGVKGKILEFLDSVSGEDKEKEWSYRGFLDQARETNLDIDFDNMEKSILTKLTRDIQVSVRDNEVSITLITK